MSPTPPEPNWERSGPQPRHDGPSQRYRGAHQPPAAPAHPPAGEPTPRRPIAWPAVFGLGALVLLWPLTSLTGIVDLVGPAPRALAVVALIGAAWIGVVGLGNLPRPVLTLTLAGAAGGCYLAVVDLMVDTASGGRAAIALLFVLLDMIGGAAWGVLAGLVAAGLQKLRGRR